MLWRLRPSELIACRNHWSCLMSWFVPIVVKKKKSFFLGGYLKSMKKQRLFLFVVMFYVLELPKWHEWTLSKTSYNERCFMGCWIYLERYCLYLCSFTWLQGRVFSILTKKREELLVKWLMVDFSQNKKKRICSLRLFFLFNYKICSLHQSVEIN